MRTKFKATLVAVLAVFGLILGGLVTAAPAQAIAGSSVRFGGGEVGMTNPWIKSTNINGLDKILHSGQTANNSSFFCPPGSNYQMRVRGPAGTWNELAPGLCYFPSKSGDYYVLLDFA